MVDDELETRTEHEMKTLTLEARTVLSRKMLPVVQATCADALLDLTGTDPKIVIGEHSMTFTDVGPFNEGPSGKKHTYVRAFLLNAALRVVPSMLAQ